MSQGQWNVRIKKANRDGKNVERFGRRNQRWKKGNNENSNNCDAVSEASVRVGRDSTNHAAAVDWRLTNVYDSNRPAYCVRVCGYRRLLHIIVFQ